MIYPTLKDITDCLPDFTHWLQSEDRRPRTITSYNQDVRLFTAWFVQAHGNPPGLTDITALDARDYRTHLQEVCDLTPNTINRRLASLRVFLEWAVEAGHLATNPAAKIRNVKQVESGPRWLSRTEQNRLLNVLERSVQAAQSQAGQRVTTVLEQALRDRAIIVTLLNTGLRVLELAQLKLSDVSLSERKGNLQVRDGKGGKARTLPLNTATRQAISTYLAIRSTQPSSPLFLGQRGAIGSRQLQRLLKKYSRQAGLESETVTTHSLRHTFGKNLVDSGVSLDQVAQLMGHANLNTTRIYTTPGRGDLERAVERISPDE